MPTPSQAVDNDDTDMADFEYYGWEGLVTERRRTDSDRSNFGIPADDNDFFRGMNNEYDLSTAIPSASQASFCQGSWETVSATSHGTPRSLQQPMHGQYGQPRRVSRPVGTSPPHITVNGFSTQPVNATNTNRTRPDAGSATDESRLPDYGAYSQTLADFSDSMSPTPHTSSPDPSQWMEELGFAKQIDLDGTQDHSLAYTGMNFAQISSSIESSGLTQHFYPDIDQLSPAETQGGSPQAAIGPSWALTLDFKQASNASLHDSQNEESQKPIGRQTPKRKRDNVDKINSVRVIGACIRCAVLHEQCDVGDPCTTCKSNAQKAKIWRQPCVRLSLRAAEVHRTSALSFPTGIRRLSWISNKNITLSLYNVGFVDSPESPISRPHLQVVCREFHTVAEDPLAKSWISKGQRFDLVLPAYAIDSTQMKYLNESLDALINTHFHQLLDELKSRQHELIAISLQEATRYVEKCPMLRNALSIAIMTRLSMRSFNITGPQTLGIDRVEDPESPYCGRIPIPPLLDAQLDHLWRGKMSRTSKSMLPQLKSMIMDKTKRRENWYMIFLTILVLLSNLEMIYQNQYQQELRYGKTNQRQMESWKYAAEILNAHFHAICHGDVPLNMDWDHEAQQAADLDAQSLAFLSALKRLASSQVDELHKRAKDPLHTPLVWISALFLGSNRT